MTDILKILDNRTPFQAGKNYKISLYNERVVMDGLVAVISTSVGLQNVWAEKIESDENWKPGEKYHVKPDYFLYIQRKGEEARQWTIEVKTTRYDSFLNDQIIVKAPQVWTCKNKPDDFPNPYVLAATHIKFALIPMGSFWNTPAQEIKFGNFIKKGYLLNVDDYEWQPFIDPLKFYEENNKAKRY